MAGGSIAAAAYHRMSADEEEAGIPHLRTAVEDQSLSAAPAA
jgi:hypothetical protein